MSAYFGDEETQGLQRKSDSLMTWIMETPGACVTGRMMAADDWLAFGWDQIVMHLKQDGMFAFRWLDPESVTEVRDRLSEIEGTLFEWNGLIAEASDLSIRTTSPLPDEFTEGPAGPKDLKAIQTFLAKHGIAPLSTDLLGGTLCPARSYVIKDRAGNIAATGFTGMLQNRFSPLADCAWMGLIAVAPTCRGQGFGSRITTRPCRASLEDLGAKRVIAFVAPDNPASIAMLTGAGLSPRPEKSCVAVSKGGPPTS